MFLELPSDNLSANAMTKLWAQASWWAQCGAGRGVRAPVAIVHWKFNSYHQPWWMDMVLSLPSRNYKSWMSEPFCEYMPTINISKWLCTALKYFLRLPRWALILNGIGWQNAQSHGGTSQPNMISALLGEPTILNTPAVDVPINRGFIIPYLNVRLGF